MDGALVEGLICISVFIAFLAAVWLTWRWILSSKIPRTEAEYEAEYEKVECVNCGYDLRATPLRCPECGLFRQLQGGFVGDLCRVFITMDKLDEAKLLRDELSDRGIDCYVRHVPNNGDDPHGTCGQVLYEIMVSFKHMDNAKAYLRKERPELGRRPDAVD